MFRSNNHQQFSAFDVRPPTAQSSCGGFQEARFGERDRFKQSKELLDKGDEKRLAESMNQLSLEEVRGRTVAEILVMETFRRILPHRITHP